METVNTEVVVIGGGVVGIAVARQFAIRGAQVILVEKESSLGSGTSARNSGVIHAGLYYVQDSLKERLCLRGKQLLSSLNLATSTTSIRESGRLFRCGTKGNSVILPFQSKLSRGKDDGKA